MSVDGLPTLRESLEAHGLWAKKAFGQHFLLDLNITRKIARLAQVGEGDHVIEVGRGFYATESTDDPSRLRGASSSPIYRTTPKASDCAGLTGLPAGFLKRRVRGLCINEVLQQHVPGRRRSR